MKEFIILLLLTCSYLHSLEKGLFAQKKSQLPISKVILINERCSGSNYLRQLIKKNLKIETEPPESFIGHCHFPPWYELPQDHYRGNPQYFSFENTDDILFIILFRDPYDWVRSMHLQPWHVHDSLLNISFDRFIRTMWLINNEIITSVEAKLNPYLDINPETRHPFNNVLELRTAKIKNMLLIKDRAPNVYYLNYEIARDHPEEVLDELAQLFGLQKNPIYIPMYHFKGDPRQGKYQGSRYDPISKADCNYINSQLSEELENAIGYTLCNCSDHILQNLSFRLNKRP